MLIGTAQRIATVTNELNINLENQLIKNVNAQTLLGIYIDNNLDWKVQVDHICKNINSRLFLLSKIQKYLDKKSRILFFNSYILPIFDYCSNVCRNLNDERIQRITKLQKRAARIILDAPFLTPTRELFENQNWLSFCDRISYNKLVLVYEILQDKTPNYLQKLCIPSSEVHTRNLRSYLVRERSFNLKGVMVFVSFIIFFSNNTRVFNNDFTFISPIANIYPTTCFMEIVRFFCASLISSVNQSGCLEYVILLFFKGACLFIILITSVYHIYVAAWISFIKFI